MLEIAEARTDAEILSCFPVMVHLRPQLAEEGFVARVREQQAEGYHLVSLRTGGETAAVAGFRYLSTLFCNRYLYVDDLVTEPQMRSRGYGATLLQWLRDKAAAEGCDELHLDSATYREAAHRFYKEQGLEILGYHFRVRL